MRDLVVERVKRALHAEHRAKMRNRDEVDGPTVAKCWRKLREIVDAAEEEFRRDWPGNPPVGPA